MIITFFYLVIKVSVSKFDHFLQNLFCTFSDRYYCSLSFLKKIVWKKIDSKQSY